MRSRLLSSLEHFAAADGERPALIASDGPSLSYARLLQAILARHRWLQAAGLPGHSRIAVLLPDGFDAAVEILAILTHASCVPLNPALSEAELRHQLSDGQVDALVHASDPDTPVGQSIGELAIPSIRVVRSAPGSPAGWQIGATARPIRPPPATVPPALILQTSGTTGLPKRVPLGDDNLTAAALAIAGHLSLTPSDRALNMLPLCHVHGLVGSVLATLHSGGSVICTTGFEHDRFTQWIERLKPTWYTATPTIHLAALAATDHAAAAVAGRLRFIRSASAPLPPEVIHRLERRFSAPVIEAYGTTEASSPISSNPLPPGVRKAGSVGLPCGTRIRIIDSTGGPVPAGATGEISVRGPGLMAGYETGPQGGATAQGANDGDDPFVDGWFRTGDLGRLDADGYLYIVGRIKDQINRGGETLSPREVDDALMAIADVRDAAAFAIPHPRLGEDVAAAVQLREGSLATADAIRERLLGSLAPQKIPSVIHIVDRLPRNANGKIQRHELSARQWPTQAVRHDAPQPADALVQSVMRAWQSVLGIADVAPGTDFFASGGDSLQAARVLARLNEEFAVELPAAALFRHRTVERLADLIRDSIARDDDARMSRQRQGGAVPDFADIDSLTDEEVERELAALSALQGTP